ncbi:MAG: alpha-amylase [Acidobacteria bacterium]|nr:alpha-amylase [Acidobacteriota bacterium]
MKSFLFFFYIFLVSSATIVAVLRISVPAQTRDFSKEKARQVPSWIRDAVIYELNPRIFSQAGNFNGITERLDELKSLGVTIIWLMPVHPSGIEKKKGTIGSPYAVRDYYAVNPDYGSRDDFRRLITEAHKRGLKIIIDVVANHTSWDSVMMKDPEYYKRDAKGNILSPFDWSDVAALDYNNRELRKYMIEMLKFWLREFDLDGYRCDVAGLVPTDFWEEARQELEKVKKDIVMLAEWDQPDLLVRAFDLDYSWILHHTMADIITKGRPASAFREDWKKERSMSPQGALHLRFSDNHDEKRAIGYFGERGALAASTLMFTLDGVPLLYNGMEAGDATESGAPALFERLPVFWKTSERRPEFKRFYNQIISMRHKYNVLRQGSVEWISNSDEDRIVSFVRRDGYEEILVAINLSNRSFRGTVEAGAGSEFSEITPDIYADSMEKTDQERKGSVTKSALPVVSLDAWGFRLFHRSLR